MFRVTALAFAAILSTGAAPARADDAAMFMDRFSGDWAGVGELLVGEESGLQFQCELDGEPSRTRLTFAMTGRCWLGRLSARIHASLHYNAHTNEFYGSFLGGADGDGLDVVGQRAGDGFSMRLVRGGVQGRLTAEAVNPDRLEVIIYYRDVQNDRELPVVAMAFDRDGMGRGEVTGSIQRYE
jgi:hypothetical protein